MKEEGEGSEGTMPSGSSPFHFFFAPAITIRYNSTGSVQVSVQFGGDCAYWKRLLRRLFPFPSERLPRRLRRYCLTFTCKEFLIFNFHMLKHCIQGARLLSSHPRLFVHSFIHFNPKTKDANPYSFLAN